MPSMRKIIKKTILVLAALFILLILYLSVDFGSSSVKMRWGASFSKSYAESLGLDWKQTYLALLDDLKVSNFRLSSYWSEIEKSRGVYDFSDLDFMVQNAAERNRKIVFTLGLRQPRWPECHVPSWAGDMPWQDKQGLVLEFVKKTVERYKDQPAIEAWQVENEFFVKWFGICPKGEEGFLTRELDLVRSLDSRPIILTDSGELSWWFKAARGADIFGTTMYRKVYAPWGVAQWPYPPVYYSRLGKLVRAFAGFERMIIAELQAEPWAKTTLKDDSTAVNYITFDPEQFKKNIAFASRSGIPEAYLWGGEWWYYMKTVRGVDDYWDIAKKLWQERN